MCHGVRAASKMCPQSLRWGPLVQPRQVLPLVFSSGGKLHMWRLSSLAVHHQRQLQRLASLVGEEANCGAQTFVACSVVGHQRFASVSSAAVADVLFSSTGVNHALHRQLNAGKTLKGILKGCAEQNALGVAAASGHRYSAITDVYLYALSWPPLCEHRGHTDSCGHGMSEGGSVDGGQGTKTTSSVKGAVFPCPECWQKLSAVATMRREEGEMRPLSLFVHAHNETVAMRSVSVARDYLAVTPTPAMDVTIVLSG